jgi:hypothetical protein
MSYEGQYNPKLVTCSLAAPSAALGIPVAIPNLPAGVVLPYTIVGKAADNFFAITNTTDMVSMITGADGNTSLAINPDESGQIAITIKRASLGNRVLSILFRAQRLIGQGQLPAFTFPVTVRDNNATPPTTHAGFNCMILRQPDDTFGMSDGDITWGFVAPTLISNFSSRLV